MFIMSPEPKERAVVPPPLNLGNLSRLQMVAVFGLFEAAFYFSFTYAMHFSAAVPAPFWFPDSILIFALLVTPPRQWWLFFLGWLPIRLFTNLTPNSYPWLLATNFANDALKALLVAIGLRRFLKNPARFHNLRDFGIFILFAVVLAPVLSAFAGAGCRYFLGFAFWPNWRRWYLGDALANLVLTPALLYWLAGGFSALRHASVRRCFEAVALTIGLALSGVVAFTGRSESYGAPALLYVPVPFLLWAAMRFGMRGASGALTLIAVFAIEGAAYGRGPFSTRTGDLNVLSIQLFLFVISVSIFLLAILVGDKNRAMDALTEASERFRNLADTAPVLIWMAGTDKLCNFFNKGWLEFTGRSLDQELGNGWADGVHPEDLAHCLDTYGTAFDKRETFTMEYRLRRWDGEYRWILDTGTPRFDAAGAFVGYIGSCLDIAERKQAELDYQLQATELARVGRLALMGELAASLAHEVNNPLGAMVTNASAGQRLITSGKIDMQDLKDLLADIVTDGHRAREVIQGIRNMVRKTETSRSVIRIGDTIHDLLRIVRADALSRQVIVVADLDADAGQVMADRVQLLQVLLNLTMNAFEAMSVIRANARRLTIRARRDESGEVLISVRDSGPGFPGGIVEHLFEPFFSTKAEGTGMGLTIAHSIIEAHGGTLLGENCDGGGACFTVRLPEAREDKSKAA
jgi:PAS domain S-box-containing protein